MNYASLSEVYDAPIIKEQENKYNDIMKNLVQHNERQGYLEGNTHEPVGIQRSKYTTYQNVENFSNSLEGDKIIKDIETKFDREYNQPEASRGEYITLKDTEESDCLKFLDHISKCEKCRNFMMKKLKLTPETPEQKNREEMLDIAIYILTGVFVLFLLDSFMSLGKFIKR